MERERNQKENWYGEIEEKASVWRGRDRVWRYRRERERNQKMGKYDREREKARIKKRVMG